MSGSLWPHGLLHARLPCPSLSPGVCPFMFKLMSIELMIPSISSSVFPLLLLPSVFPSTRVFSNESVLRIRWAKGWRLSFSISASNEYSGLISFMIDWFDLLVVKGFSRVFSSTTVWKHQFFSTQLSLWSNSHIRTWLLEKPQLGYTDPSAFPDELLWAAVLLGSELNFLLTVQYLRLFSPGSPDSPAWKRELPAVRADKSLENSLHLFFV